MSEISMRLGFVHALNEHAQQARALAARAEHGLPGVPEIAHTFRMIAGEIERCALDVPGPASWP
jgi:hypothetical protein